MTNLHQQVPLTCFSLVLNNIKSLWLYYVVRLHKFVYTVGSTEWHHLLCSMRGSQECGSAKGTADGCVWETSYLTVGADGSQLCVWPRPRRDGGREEGRRESVTVWLLWMLWWGWSRCRSVHTNMSSKPSRIRLGLSEGRNAAPPLCGTMFQLSQDLSATIYHLHSVSSSCSYSF